MRIFALFLMLVSTAALATQDHTCQGGNNCNENPGEPETITTEAIAETSSVSDSLSESRATGGGGGTASVGGVETTVSINEARERSSRTIYTTPSARAPTIYPTVPCFEGKSVAIGLPWMSGSRGSGKIDQGCVEREIIRLAPTPAHKLFMWCSQDLSVERFGSVEDCLTHGVADPGDEPPPDELMVYTVAAEDEQPAEEAAKQQSAMEGLEQRIKRQEALTRRQEAIDATFYEQLQQFKESK